MTKKKLLVATLLTLIFTGAFIFRENFLRGTGDFLIKENKPKKADVIFVLGGDSYDRGNKAIELFKQGYSQKIICLGENVPTIFKALGISYSESEVTKINIQKQIADSQILVLKKGTSTMEESQAIIKYCIENKINSAIIITSKFHTRRVRNVLKTWFDENKIQLFIVGAPSSLYPENEWWKSEDGLITVNNEYVKLVYYFFKY